MDNFGELGGELVLEEGRMFEVIKTAVSQRLARSKPVTIILSLAMTLLIGRLEYATKREIVISVFYLVPICWLTWNVGRKAGLLLATVCVTIWMVADVRAHHIYFHPAIRFWNAFMLLVIYVIVAWLLSAVRGAQEQLQKSKDELERRVAERTASLHEQQQKLEAIVQAAAEGIFTIDGHGIVESMNIGAERIFGYRAEEVLGHNVSMLMPSPNREQHDGYLARYLETGQAKIIGTERELMGRCKNGATFPMDLCVSKCAFGGVTKFVGLVRDTTVRKHEEKARNLLAAIVESSEDAIISQTMDSVIMSWNAGAERLYGYSAAEVVGRSITLLIPPALLDEEFQILEKVKRGEQVQHFETIRLDKHGSPINVSLIISSVKDAGGRVIGASKIVRDITQRKRLEAAADAASEAERGRIARDLHDGLGQQLGGALFLSDLLKRDLKDLGAVEGTRAEQIHGLIVDALRQAREVSRGLYPLPPEPDGLMTALQTMADHVARDRQIECIFDTDSAVLLSDQTLATNLYRIAQEALNNALKHSGAMRIEIKLANTARNLELSVRDFGRGMPESAPSLGLGLQTMSHRALLIGGRLIVQNAEGGGVRVACSVSRTWMAAQTPQARGKKTD